MKITNEVVQKSLDFAYDKAVNASIPGLDNAYELAESYNSNIEKNLIKDVNSLIRWQNGKSATTGFLTGLGGIILMPATLPANLTSVFFIQIRMIAAIAHMGGHDLKDDKVKTLVYACLLGNGLQNILKEVGIEVGVKLTKEFIKGISGKVIIEINKKVGFRLLTKFGEKGVVNLGKTIPLVGGIVGSVFDSVSTNAVGNIARNTFVSEKKS